MSLQVNCGSFGFPDDDMHPIRIELLGLMIRCLTDSMRGYNWLDRLVFFRSYRFRRALLKREVGEAERIALKLAERTNAAQAIAKSEQSTLDSRIQFDLKQLVMLETSIAEAKDYV